MDGLASIIVLCAYFLVVALFGGQCGVESALSARANCRQCSGSKMLRSTAALNPEDGVATGENDSEMEMMHEARREYYRALILHKLNVTEMTGGSNGGDRASAAFGSVASPARQHPQPAPSLLEPLLAPFSSEVAAQNLQWLPEPLLAGHSFLPQDRPGDIKLNDFYAETKQYMLVAGDASAECRSNSARRRTCMRFNVKSVNARDAIVSAKLYVWTPEIDRLLSRGGEDGGHAATVGGVVQVRQLSAQWRPGAIVTESLLPKAASFGGGAGVDGDDGGDGTSRRSNQSNWLQFDLHKDAVRSWLGGGPDISVDGVVRLELACKDCAALTVDMNKRRPFLLIDIEQPEAVERLQQQQRSKRQAASGGGSTKLYCDQVPAGQQTCCIERLQVLFSEFYPHIVHPKGFYPNYCRGSCSAFGQQIAYANTNIVRAKLDSKKMRYVPCCVPTRMASIDVLYFADDESTIQMKSLPNMVVEECGCM